VICVGERRDGARLTHSHVASPSLPLGHKPSAVPGSRRDPSAPSAPSQASTCRS
jgi:hypothetical protein